MKNLVALSIFVSVASLALAQPAPINIEGSTGKFYVVHQVAAKENWYSVGRLYNLSPKTIAPYNHLTLDQPLAIGQTLNIPLTPENFAQKEAKAADETLVPLRHTVREGEWMFKLSSIYNDVSVANLEKWNSIKRDDVKTGMPLVVGFLRVKTAESALAGQTQPLVPAAPEAVRQQAPAAAVTSVATTAAPAANAGRENGTAVSGKTGGFFGADFHPGDKSLRGVAGVFKSTSGWKDGKYYALMNEVPVGTIVRIAGASGKYVFAKVLGALPDMSESRGLTVRISNAAANDLGVADARFPVEVKY